jgi:hypothetical protein
VWRRVAGGWKIVARPKLDPRGDFHTQLRLRSGGYRVTVDGDGRFAAATARMEVTPRLLASLEH